MFSVYPEGRRAGAQEKILSQIIVCGSVFSVPGVFRPSEHVFEDYFGVPRHTETQKTTQTIVCRRNLHPEDNANHSLSQELELEGFFDTLRSFLRTISVDGGKLMARRRFTC